MAVGAHSTRAVMKRRKTAVFKKPKVPAATVS
jgi:hypothetical protein